MIILALLVLLQSFVLSVVSAPVASGEVRRYGDIISIQPEASLNKALIFTPVHWWESTDHQLTSAITLLTLARHFNATAVLPPLVTAQGAPRTNDSLVGDYLTITGLQSLQPAMTLAQFRETGEYASLRAARSGTVAFPKESQEEYEALLSILGSIRKSIISLPMPAVDPEHTNQYCDGFRGTVYTTPDGTTRFIFLDRIHFLHFCTEKFMPWWYDVRYKLSPRSEYYELADKVMGSKKPAAVIHINDAMENHQERENEEAERYARQIVDALRKHDALSWYIYLIIRKDGRNVEKVAKLLRQEFEKVFTCVDVDACVAKPGLEDAQGVGKGETDVLKSELRLKMSEWAIASRADVFIGNIHSPYSRHICLHRKLHGQAYVVLKGFGEVRKTWRWNLKR